MDGLAQAVVLSWGWRRRGVAMAAGAASALAQPPFFLFPVLWLTFPLLVLLIDGAVVGRRDGGVRRFAPAFAVGWWFGFGYFLAGLWWVGSAFLVEAEAFGWLLPVAVLGLPAGLALFWGAGVALAQVLWGPGWPRLFALALGLGLAEWLRGHLFTGFPWNALGYALTAGEILMQSAALFGVEALTIIAVPLFAAPVLLFDPARAGRRNWIGAGLALAAIAGLGLYGTIRLLNAEDGRHPDLLVRIVQPALDQAEKWRPESRDAVMSAYLGLSRSGGAALPSGTLLVWPESAFPFALTEEPEAMRAIADLLDPGTVLVTGAARLDWSRDRRRVYNSIYVIDHDGTILDAYDKVHLVPFGEYLPFQAVLESLGLEQLTRVQGGFEAGLRRRAMQLPNGPPFAPLICYEVIFPGSALPEGPRPGFLLNVTNDGWFGRTPGPYQHLHQARVRAVEEGLPLVRSANTGVSAITDAYGRIRQRSSLGQATVVDGPLPVAVAAPPAARWGSAMTLIFLAVSALITILSLLPSSRWR